MLKVNVFLPSTDVDEVFNESHVQDCGIHQLFSLFLYLHLLILFSGHYANNDSAGFTGLPFFVFGFENVLFFWIKTSDEGKMCICLFCVQEYGRSSDSQHQHQDVPTPN